MSIINAVSNANRLLPKCFAQAHGHLLKGVDHYEIQPFDVQGARRSLYFIDRVTPHAAQHAQELGQVRADLIAALEGAGAEPSPHHEQADRHDREERIERTRRWITTRLEARSIPAPNAHREKPAQRDGQDLGFVQQLDARGAWAHPTTNQHDASVQRDFLQAIASFSDPSNTAVADAARKLAAALVTS